MANRQITIGLITLALILITLQGALAEWLPTGTNITLPTEIGSPKGLATNLTHFFIVDNTDDLMYVINKSGAHTYNFSFSHSTSSYDPEGLFWNGTMLGLVDDFSNDVVYYFRNGTGNIVANTSIGGNPYGGSWNTTHIIVSSSLGDDLEGFTMGGVKVLDEDMVPSVTLPGGVTSIGEYIYYVGDGEPFIIQTYKNGTYTGRKIALEGSRSYEGMTNNGTSIFLSRDDGTEDIIEYVNTPTNLTITATYQPGNLTLNTFNTTVDGKEYTTTTGTITTTIIDTDPQPLTIITTALGGISNTTNGVSSNITTFNTVLGNGPVPTGILNNATTTVYRLGETSTLACTANDIGIGYTNITSWIVNLNDSGTYNQGNGTTNTYTIQATDFQDEINYTCEVCTIYGTCVNKSVLLAAQDTIDGLYTFNAHNWVGGLITNMYWDWIGEGINGTGNPVQVLMSNFINATDRNETINTSLTDLTYNNIDNSFLRNYNDTHTEHNFTLQPNQLTLTFYQNGALVNTTGWIADTEKTRNWSNSTLVTVQQNLTEGRVDIRFKQTSWENHTQYYEFDNTPETVITETIEVLAQNDATAWVQVFDYAGTEVRNVQIRAEAAWWGTNPTTWTYHALIGQRLTEDNGKTFFYFDDRSQVLFTLTKTGFQPENRTITIGDYAYTQDNPLIIYMQESDTKTNETVWTYIDRTYNGTKTRLQGYTTATNYAKVEVTTQYRTDQGLSTYDITENCDNQYRCWFDWRLDTDYLTNTNISTLVYVNGRLADNITTLYDGRTPTRLLETEDLSGLSQTLLRPLLFIMAVIIAAGIGFIFQGEGNAEGTFKVLAIALAFISPSFIWLAVVIIAGASFKILRRLITE